MPIQLSQFTTESLRESDIREQLPEVYQLQEVVESQGWHDNQTVYDHCIASANSLEEITKFAFVDEKHRQNLVSYLDQKYDIHTRRELLLLATLLHDIGKIISLQTNAQGNTGSPSHGLIGGWVAKPVVERFDVSEKEQAFVLSLISDHLIGSDLIELSINNNTAPEGVLELLQANRPDSAIELILVAYADWLGCDIRDEVRAEYERRIVIAQRCLGKAAMDL